MAPAIAPRVERQRLLEGLRDALRLDVRAMREVQVRVGRTLLEIRKAGDPLALGATSFSIFCEQEGLSPTEARELTAMAEAAEASPEVEARVVEARITPQKAAVVNELLREPALQKPGEDLLGLVEGKFAKDLVDEVKRRREEHRIQEPPVSLTIQVSTKGRDDFRRCRTLVSRSRGRIVSEGETLETISNDYLDRKCPERRAKRMEAKDKAAQVSDTDCPRRRGAKHAGAAAGNRCLTPALTLGLCRVDGCDSEELVRRYCPEHRAQSDSGLWWPTVRRDGEVVLIDRRGVRVGRLRRDAARFVAGRGRAPPG